MIALKRHGWSRALGLDLAAHLTLTQQLFPRSYIGTLLNGVTWTLTVFALFYLVFPLLAPLCVRRPLPTLGALCAVQLGYTLWTLPQYGSDAYSSLFNQFPAFCGVLAVGLAAALVFARLARGGWTQRLYPARAVRCSARWRWSGSMRNCAHRRMRRSSSGTSWSTGCRWRWPQQRCSSASGWG
ncbi:hypothetical protein NIA69_00810 [Gemmiger formicilis]|nr:hypothetical protein [Gemmiger formicilis]